MISLSTLCVEQERDWAGEKQIERKREREIERKEILCYPEITIGCLAESVYRICAFQDWAFSDRQSHLPRACAAFCPTSSDADLLELRPDPPALRAALDHVTTWARAGGHVRSVSRIFPPVTPGITLCARCMGPMKLRWGSADGMAIRGRGVELHITQGSALAARVAPA